MRIVFVRHGEPDYEHDCLTPAGREQALAAAERLKEENIEEICSVPGVDMVQFGPSDYSMSCGKNISDFSQEAKDAERVMIETALRHGVQPRCEISCVEESHYYIKLGVRHFCVGDQAIALNNFWIAQGSAMRKLTESL